MKLAFDPDALKASFQRAEPERCVLECARVLEPGARIDVLEPYRYNPRVLAHALAQRAERGALRSTETFLRWLQRRRFRMVKAQHHQAFPLRQRVLHPRLASSLARIDPSRAVAAGLEHAAELLVPKSPWAYVHVQGVLEG